MNLDIKVIANIDGKFVASCDVLNVDVTDIKCDEAVKHCKAQSLEVLADNVRDGFNYDTISFIVRT